MDSNGLTNNLRGTTNLIAKAALFISKPLRAFACPAHRSFHALGRLLNLCSGLRQLALEVPKIDFEFRNEFADYYSHWLQLVIRSWCLQFWGQFLEHLFLLRIAHHARINRAAKQLRVSDTAPDHSSRDVDEMRDGPCCLLPLPVTAPPMPTTELRELNGCDGPELGRFQRERAIGEVVELSPAPLTVCAVVGRSFSPPPNPSARASPILVITSSDLSP